MRRYVFLFLVLASASAGCVSQGESAGTPPASPSTSPAAAGEPTEEANSLSGSTGCTTDAAEGSGREGTFDQGQTGSVPVPPAWISEINLRVTPSCTAVVIAFADQAGPIDAVPSGIEVVSMQGQTRLIGPDGVVEIVPASGLAAHSSSFWEHGAVVPVRDGDSDYVLIVHGSFDPPIIVAQSGPARLKLEFPTVVNPEIVTLDDAFIVDRIVERQPGRIEVSGWGAAFEGHAGIGLVDANGRNVPAGDGWSVEDHTRGTTGFFSVRTGNPGVAWAPFSFTLVTDLPAGEYGLYLDACGGQCDPVPHDTVFFTLSDH